MSSNELLVTLCDPESGQSESISVARTMTVSELANLSMALLGTAENARLVKDGSPLVATMTLEQAGVRNGDLLAAIVPRQAPRPAPAPGGGLDFSSLLSGSAARSTPRPVATNNAASGGLDFSSLLAGNSAASASPSSEPVYYAGMNLAEATEANPHPNQIVKLLQSQPNLFKELNYYNPILATKLKDQSHDAAVRIWREEMVKGGIQSAMRQTQKFHKEQDFAKRLKQNPDDKEAKEYFDKQKRQRMVQQQYMQAMQEYPESMGRVLMLYVEAKINGVPLQAFVDSGAQSTIMSKKCAERCGIFDLVDDRFAGVAVGVGTGKILGRIHIAQLQIGDAHFPCSVTVMDDATLPVGGDSKSSAAPKDMDFLLGLDMLKRHTCSIDLEHGTLKFRLAPGQYLETPFLHEKDLDESKGGTKGFDAEKANAELEDLRRKHEEKDDHDMTEADDDS